MPENPPAFPNDVELPHPGMTLRDWFAGQELAGQLSDLEGEKACRKAAKQYGYTTARMMAVCCYEYADAMLAEREK